jgi:hypothetical protein
MEPLLTQQRTAETVQFLAQASQLSLPLVVVLAVYMVKVMDEMAAQEAVALLILPLLAQEQLDHLYKDMLVVLEKMAHIPLVAAAVAQEQLVQATCILVLQQTELAVTEFNQALVELRYTMVAVAVLDSMVKGQLTHLVVPVAAAKAHKITPEQQQALMD